MPSIVLLILSLIGLVAAYLHRDALPSDVGMVAVGLLAGGLGAAAIQTKAYAARHRADPTNHAQFPMHPLAFATCLFTALLGLGAFFITIPLRGLIPEGLHTTLTFAAFASIIMGIATLGTGLARKGNPEPVTVMPAVGCALVSTLLVVIAMFGMIFSTATIPTSLTTPILIAAVATLALSVAVALVLAPKIPPHATIMGRLAHKRQQARMATALR